MLLFLLQLSIMFFCLLIFKSQTWNILVLFLHWLLFLLTLSKLLYSWKWETEYNSILQAIYCLYCSFQLFFFFFNFIFLDRNAICIFLLILIRSRTLQLLETQVNLVCPSNKILLCYETWQLCGARLIGLSAEFFVTERLPAKTIYTKAERESDATCR